MRRRKVQTLCCPLGYRRRQGNHHELLPDDSRRVRRSGARATRGIRRRQQQDQSSYPLRKARQAGRLEVIRSLTNQNARPASAEWAFFVAKDAYPVFARHRLSQQRKTNPKYSGVDSRKNRCSPPRLALNHPENNNRWYGYPERKRHLRSLPSALHHD